MNGLRALAAITVVLLHTFQSTFGNWGVSGVELPIFQDGVTLFFVISGFLITYLLLKEQNKIGSVKVGSFYMRRILRIWPIYYLYIGLSIVVLYLLGKQFEILNNTFWYYMFFAANIPFVTASGIWIIVHFWSIGVEEQFYLFWPWIVKVSKNVLLPVTITIALFWFSAKIGTWSNTNKSWIYRFLSVTRFDCMLVGAVGAILYERGNKIFIFLTTTKFSQVVIWCMFIFSGFYIFYIPAVIRAEFIAIISLFLIMGQVCGKPLVSLENHFFDFIGKISYGIYVWHPIIIFLLSIIYKKMNFQFFFPLQYCIIYIVVLVVTIFVAWLSYTYYEKFFLRFKTKYAIVQSRNNMNEKIK